MTVTAADLADAAVAAVRDDPHARLGLLHDLYGPAAASGRRHLPYRRAASAFMQWQIGRGLLDADRGSPWWRALNEQILSDTAEAWHLALGVAGEPRNRAVEAMLDFIAQPSAARWYHAHNLSVVTAYDLHEDLAWREGRVERFFINLVLLRVLYAHALVAEPRLALSWGWPAAPPLGDPRLGMTAIFLSLKRVLPDRYPLGENAERVTSLEGSFGHLLDVGVIMPRIEELYLWSAEDLGVPDLKAWLVDGIPAYAWDPTDRGVWAPEPSRWARAARVALPIR